MLNFDLDGPLLVISGWAPPRPGGSTTILRNLLEWFDPSSYLIFTERPPHGEATAAPLPGARLVYGSSNWPYERRGHQLWSFAQIPVATARAVHLCRTQRVSGLFGVFPDIQYLLVAYLTHRLTGLPFAAYLHDCLAENGFGGYLGALARWLQPRIFESARPLFVMSDAMAGYLQAEYGVAGTPLVHCYNETIPITQPEPPNTASGLRLMFSGAVGELNGKSFRRIADAVATIPGCELDVYGYNLASPFQRFGIGGPSIRSGFISDRSELLTELRRHDLLVGCLSWPDESEVGKAELKTIFSTKIPEYLAQGRPLFIHAPADYAISTFVREHDCGWVVSEREGTQLADTLRAALVDRSERERRGRNALHSAKMFEGKGVAEGLVTTLHRAWGYDEQ